MVPLTLTKRKQTKRKTNGKPVEVAQVYTLPNEVLFCEALLLPKFP